MKRDRLEHVVSRAGVLRCPRCGTAVLAQGASLICKNGHCFDVSAKGYVNFVPAQRDTLYDACLFESRARIHARGAYAPVAAAVRGALRELVPPQPQVLDAGCGDGHYARYLSDSCRVFALDLSKQAIALAARGGMDACLMVGDLTRLPLADGSMDAVVNVLSPAHYPEFRRVLKSGGYVIKVVPQEAYLTELRQAASGLIRHATYSNAQTVELFLQQFPEAVEREVCAVFPIDDEDTRRDALRMTPMLTGVDKTAPVFAAIDRITVSVKLLIGRKG